MEIGEVSNNITMRLIAPEEVDILTLETGIYLIKASTVDKTSIQKLIVEKINKYIL